MNEDQFNACITSDAALTALQKRAQDHAVNDHVDATPTFVINGVIAHAGLPPADLDHRRGHRGRPLESSRKVKAERCIFSGFAFRASKSFVEGQEFRIEPGLTGVVGPNGCGKSNLLEAIRWVMGANSAKAMRARRHGRRHLRRLRRAGPRATTPR